MIDFAMMCLCYQDRMDASGVALVLIGPGSVDQVWIHPLRVGCVCVCYHSVFKFIYIVAVDLFVFC